MSKIKQGIKSALQLMFGKRPIVKTVQITQLAPTDLLKGRCALVTGGTSGIGYAIAEAMLRAGADAVVITGRTESKCQQAVEKLKKCFGGDVYYQVLDNRDVNSFDEKIREVLEKLNGRELSILVNNAGVQGPHFGDTTEADYDNVMDTNVKGMYFLTQKVARYMKDKHVEGNVLNVASSSSLRPAANTYTLSKVAIKEFTEGMAKTLIPYGIVVNAVAPGPTATPMLRKDSERSDIAHGCNPIGRFAMPCEIANMVVFLTSNMGRTIVGSIVYMSGGGGITTYEDVGYPF